MGKPADLLGRKVLQLNIGDVQVARSNVAIRTVLGSCVGVCLYDPFVQAGGMNHFMLPGDDPEGPYSGRYGLQAMELLLNACMSLGALPSRLQIKVFGGADMLSMLSSGLTVSQRNIRFIQRYLDNEGFSAVAMDLGGLCAREVYFLPDTGKTLVRRICDDGVPEFRRIVKKERAVSHRPPPASDDSNITLFDQ
ncbi:MAG TPA: chemotaxis protein CheD [Fimbriimonadaceae bacterium]|nr:chemotaxis protein CheD [Fimbriimonadaceae bacterium]